MNFKTISLWIFVAIALATLMDTLFSFKTITEEVIYSRATKEQYFNAARNSHTTYKVITANHSFYVDEVFHGTTQPGDRIEIKQSLLFDEINGYKKECSANYEMSNMRIVSGYASSIAMLLVAILGFQFKNKVNTLVFVTQSLTLGNFIYLIQ